MQQNTFFFVITAVMSTVSMQNSATGFARFLRYFWAS